MTVTLARWLHAFAHRLDARARRRRERRCARRDQRVWERQHGLEPEPVDALVIRHLRGGTDGR